jgi:2-keto-4-pentenoate hydratase
MTATGVIRSAADALRGAYATRQPIAPLSATYPGLGVEDAYAIQAAQVAAWESSRGAVRGYKVGLTSPAMQRQLGVDQPDYGFLFDDMYHPDGAVLDAAEFIAPRVEPEIAVVLGRDLTGPGLTADDVAGAVDRVVGALEIIDSRIAEWKITLVDTIADNASSAGLVLGETTSALADIDPVTLRVGITRNGEDVGSGSGEDVMGSPLNAVAWLANTLGGYGVTLRAGSVVLPGSVCAAVAVGAGDRIVADFGILGTVTVSFDEGEQR